MWQPNLMFNLGATTCCTWDEQTNKQVKSKLKGWLKKKSRIQKRIWKTFNLFSNSTSTSSKQALEFRILLCIWSENLFPFKPYFGWKPLSIWSRFWLIHRWKKIIATFRKWKINEFTHFIYHTSRRLTCYLTKANSLVW